MANNSITIKTFDNPIQAHLEKNRLVDAGIPAMLADENLVGMNWALSNAVGGIRLQVSEDDAAKAIAILDAEPEDSEPDDLEPKPTAREENAERAFRGATFGLVFPPLQFYVFWLLLRVYVSDEELRGRHRSRALWAAAINIPVMLIMGTVLRSMLTGS